MAEKNRMQIAAYYGGLAITASGTTAVHALSYPLGGKYHIAHGVSNAILLAPVMRFNSEHPAVKERLAVAYDRCCHENKTCTTVTRRLHDDRPPRSDRQASGHPYQPEGVRRPR